MQMNDIIMYVLIGIIGVFVLGVAIYWLVKFCKLSKEDKKKLLLVYLKGMVAQAEKEIGAGHGMEKLQEVEEYFDKNAGWFMKMLRLLTGKEHFVELIELALTEIKDNFCK